jgi:aryl-alcohol dehydrogenase-like predicted oxidoreductase
MTFGVARLGRTGCNVTRIGYGAMDLREPLVLHKVLDAGINFIDVP